MSTLMKRKQKNNEVKHSIRMINQLDTENDIQINENIDTFSNNINAINNNLKQNYLDGAGQIKGSNEEFIKVIKAENKSKSINNQNSYDYSLNSPNFNKQNVFNNNVSIVSQSQGFSKYNKNTNRNNYQEFIYNLSLGIDSLNENLGKDFEDIQNLIENTLEEIKNKNIYK